MHYSNLEINTKTFYENIFCYILKSKSLVLNTMPPLLDSALSSVLKYFYMEAT